jgi:hypothetical protein
VWPAGASDGIRVGDGPPGLHEPCLTRDTLADTVVLLSAMSVEAFLDYYGVVRLGDEQFNPHSERLGTEKKLCVVLLVCDGLAVRFPTRSRWCSPRAPSFPPVRRCSSGGRRRGRSCTVVA